MKPIIISQNAWDHLHETRRIVAQKQEAEYWEWKRKQATNIFSWLVAFLAGL